MDNKFEWFGNKEYENPNPEVFVEFDSAPPKELAEWFRAVGFRLSDANGKQCYSIPSAVDLLNKVEPDPKSYGSGICAVKKILVEKLRLSFPSLIAFNSPHRKYTVYPTPNWTPSPVEFREIDSDLMLEIHCIRYERKKDKNEQIIVSINEPSNEEIETLNLCGLSQLSARDDRQMTQWVIDDTFANNVLIDGIEKRLKSLECKAASNGL